MITGFREPFAGASDAHLMDWLTTGVLCMSGQNHSVDRAFEPYAPLIGHSRELAWIDELISFALSLDANSRQAFDRAAVGSLMALANGDLGRNWIPILHILDLIRNVDARGSVPALAVLANQLSLKNLVIDVGVRRQLLAAAILAATEAKGTDRVEVRPVAVNLAKQILAISLDSELGTRDGILDRLMQLGVSEDVMKKAGLLPYVEEVKMRIDLRNRFINGRTHVDA